MTDLEARVRQLEARLEAIEAVREIHELKARYAELIDSRYTQDGPRPAEEVAKIADEQNWASNWRSYMTRHARSRVRILIWTHPSSCRPSYMKKCSCPSWPRRPKGSLLRPNLC